MSERPEYIIWGDHDDYQFVSTLAEALKAKSEYGGCIYEVLGARAIQTLDLQAEVERLEESIRFLWKIYSDQDKAMSASDVFRRAGWPKEDE
jgi:hypothetical protein